MCIWPIVKYWALRDRRERSKDKDGTDMHTCKLITIQPNALMAFIYRCCD
jgi:hypothetical protein